MTNGEIPAVEATDNPDVFVVGDFSFDLRDGTDPERVEKIALAYIAWAVHLRDLETRSLTSPMF